MAIIKHMSGVHFFWPQKEVNLRMIMDGYGVSNGVHSTMGPGYGVSFASCTKKMMNSSSPQLSVVVSQLLCFLSLIGLLTSSSEGSQRTTHPHLSGLVPNRKTQRLLRALRSPRCSLRPAPFRPNGTLASIGTHRAGYPQDIRAARATRRGQGGE